MGNLKWEFTTYSDGQGHEFPAVFVRWEEVTRFLGHPHTGDYAEDETLVRGLLDAGAPDWVDAPLDGWIDEYGWGLVAPALEWRLYRAIDGALWLVVFESSELRFTGNALSVVPVNSLAHFSELRQRLDKWDTLQDLSVSNTEEIYEGELAPSAEIVEESEWRVLG